MIKSVSISFRQISTTILNFRIPRILIYIFVVSLILVYVVIQVNTPILLWMTGESDDGLDMALGRHLSQGEWLGPYTRFTLKKGPGYAAFLAATSWLGISVSLAHALFHSSAILLFVAISHRFIKSVLLSLFLFALLLWHPIALTQPMLRVARNTIYPGQVLIFLALLAYALFCANGPKNRTIFGCLSGMVLAWLWLTREEGIWLVPAIGVLIAAAAFHGFRERKLREIAISAVAMAVTFGTMQVGFQAINWRVYGKFVGVDVKEANFQSALRGLNSVVAGDAQPFVPVTRRARLQIYAVSPAFSSLAGYLDGPPAALYRDGGCRPQRHLLPVPCGEIVGGWFIWALRDAAAWAGHYASPARASEFFGRIAGEVATACAQGLLECKPQFISEMPRVSGEQIALIPGRYLAALDLLFFREKPGLNPPPSTGDEDLFDVNLRFLNYPRHTQSRDIQSLLVIRGWYYKSGQDWITARVKTPEGLDTFSFERLRSPDIAAYFHDAEAFAQRFIIRTTCGNECWLELSSSDGATLQKTLAELGPAPLNFRLGGGFVQVESAETKADSAYVTKSQIELSQRVRQSLVDWYNYIFVPMVMFGLVAFVGASIRYWREAALNACFVMAFVSWILIFVRVTLLILIDVTSFPALEFNYLTPAYFLIVSGAVFSIAAWAQLSARGNLAAKSDDQSAPAG